MAYKQHTRSMSRRASRLAVSQRSRPRQRRGKSTFYRYRRGLPPGFWRGALVGAFLLLGWWVALGARGEKAGTRAQHPGIRRGLTGPIAGPIAATATPAPAPLPITGGPSLDSTRIDGILAAYGSPLARHGRDIVDLSRRYGIDDAVALAFFVMESRAGTQGEAMLTHSFGNLRPMPGAPQQDGYRSYHDWLEGTREWFKVLRSLYLDTMKLRTVDAVVPVYAPATDSNVPASMIAGIRQLVTCWRGTADACPADPPGIPALVTGTSH